MSHLYETSTKEKLELFCEIRNIIRDCIGDCGNNNLIVFKIMMLLDEKTLEKDIRLRRALDQINHSSN